MPLPSRAAAARQEGEATARRLGAGTRRGRGFCGRNGGGEGAPWEGTRRGGRPKAFASRARDRHLGDGAGHAMAEHVAIHMLHGAGLQAIEGEAIVRRAHKAADCKSKLAPATPNLVLFTLGELHAHPLTAGRARELRVVQAALQELDAHRREREAVLESDSILE